MPGESWFGAVLGGIPMAAISMFGVDALRSTLGLMNGRLLPRVSRRTLWRMRVQRGLAVGAAFTLFLHWPAAKWEIALSLAVVYGVMVWGVKQ